VAAENELLRCADALQELRDFGGQRLILLPSDPAAARSFAAIVRTIARVVT
jgi:hypothetical protein